MQPYKPTDANMTDLKRIFGTANPVALVTGSGSPRVGSRVAHHLAMRGYRLVLHANASIEQAQATTQEFNDKYAGAIAISADLVDELAVSTMFANAYKEFGRLDAVVNCAAIWESKSLEQVAAADVRRHFDVNTLGSFLCCQQAGLIMADQPTGGAIVNVGDWAIARPYADYSAYFASKGAIPAMTRSFAVELSRRNSRIRVSAVLPGPVMLPPDMPSAEKEAAIAGTLVKREGSPQHVADAVAFLLENDFITGVCLPVDGGRSIY